MSISLASTMFSLIQNLPGFAVGVKMRDEVTKEDFDRVLLPALEIVSKEWKAINLLLVIETSLTNFTKGAWRKDIMTNIRYYWKWNKIGMVTKDKTVETTFKAFDLVIPGEVKLFSDKELPAAIAWISEP